MLRLPRSVSLPPSPGRASADAVAQSILQVTHLRRDQFTVHRIPAPQIVIGQLRAAPPAVDRVVPAEIIGPGQNGLAERGQRQLAFLVAPVSTPVVVHLIAERPLLKTSHGR